MIGWIQSWLARREYRRIVGGFQTADQLRGEAAAYDPARCAALVEDLVSWDKGRAWLAFQALQATSAAATPALVAALSDRRFLTAQPEDRHALREFNTPLMRVLAVLERRLPCRGTIGGSASFTSSFARWKPTCA
jgi:hypothetical protein